MKVGVDEMGVDETGGTADLSTFATSTSQSPCCNHSYIWRAVSVKTRFFWGERERAPL